MQTRFKKEILYVETGLRLEKLVITMGECRTTIWRELTWTAKDVELREFAQPPLWWQRWINIESIVSPARLRYGREYYIKNKTKMDEYSKQWKLQNKEKWNEYQRNYKKRKYHEVNNKLV